MDVDLVFKIAAVGILVSVLNQVLTRSGPGGTGHHDHAGGTDCGADDGCPENQRPLRAGQDPVWTVMRYGYDCTGRGRGGGGPLRGGGAPKDPGDRGGFGGGGLRASAVEYPASAGDHSGCDGGAGRFGRHLTHRSAAHAPDRGTGPGDQAGRLPLPGRGRRGRGILCGGGRRGGQRCWSPCPC